MDHDQPQLAAAVPRRRRRRLALLVLVAILAAGAVGPRRLPAYLEHRQLFQQAREAIAQMRAGRGEEADVILLEDAVAPLGVPGVRALAEDLWETADIRILQAFDGLDPRLTLPEMARLRGHKDPEVRHGAWLSLARAAQVEAEQWHQLLADPGEDRFVRQLAAHQLQAPPGWWQDLDAGSPPAAPAGVGLRRVTFLRAHTTIGELAAELAWVTGRGAQVTPEAAAEPLERVYYFHVPLEGLLGDIRLHERYQLHAFALNDRGQLIVRRVYAEER